jgi:hypothetical protein
MSDRLERRVIVNGRIETVMLRPRATATRLSREEKAKAREEARLRESIERHQADGQV